MKFGKWQILFVEKLRNIKKDMYNKTKTINEQIIMQKA